ncbi:GIN domain-containing protein [Flagellimonas allohymeniacidonis]|uniref:DUF2807 domain-containing protein n=1 Tax=Flagellimonas allohymeniacidonis TaxID=2517819 RepID=A0A4Q8QJS6_9FLAO|nr:DUF2807 domain-containing protein [Allomuricauda hymeniacidonis]TAI48749.1 DUF2807 domain-containing protein [Allomuricauda hymeniacidonis]
MKTNIIYGLVLATGFLLASCDTESIKVSNEVSTREYSFTDFDELEVSGDFDVFVRFSDTEESITVEANTNVQDRIIVSKGENRLRVQLENRVSIRGNATLKVYITTQNISSYRISGDSFVELENVLLSTNVSINVLGDSRFLGEVDTNNLLIDINGDSEVDVFGEASRLNADLSGDSELRDYDLSIEDLILTLSGDSIAFLSVANTIDVNATGDSELNYRGEAEIVRQRLSGDARINKRD